MIEYPTARLLVHWVPAIMLVLAFGAWPYGYFMLLRVIVFLGASLLAFDIYRRAGDFELWCVVFVAIAVLFNPLLPVHLTRAVWGVIDPAVAGLFAVHFFVSRTQKTP
jgi:hypothetical protein